MRALSTLGKVRIGGLDYSVILYEDLREDDEKLDGQFCHSQSEIGLEEALGPQAREAMLWHEILHGILVHMGKSNEHDEEIVAGLAYGIVQVLRDNEWVHSLRKE